MATYREFVRIILAQIAQGQQDLQSAVEEVWDESQTIHVPYFGITFCVLGS